MSQSTQSVDAPHSFQLHSQALSDEAAASSCRERDEAFAAADPFTAIIRDGARRLIAQAVEAEVALHLQRFEHLIDQAGHKLIVRNGHARPRSVSTGVGPVEVAMPRVRDKRPLELREKFTSMILPPYLRKTRSIEDLIPWLYLKGISTGDFGEALQALLGADAPGLSPTTVTRLKACWADDHKAWSRRDLTGKRYVYVWADGIHFNARLEDERSCILVLMGATADGTKELIAVADGIRESEISWKDLMLDVKARGLTVSPELVIADGALGFWAALPKVWPKSREQRCTVHKTANVLNKLPKGQHAKARGLLNDIWQAPTKKDALKAFDHFVGVYEDKYPKAITCLNKSKDQTLTFFDFPAEHWLHIRTTNPIESTFATVRLRTTKTKGCGTRDATLMMVFKLCEAAQKNWRRLNGHTHMSDIIAGRIYIDGLPEDPQRTATQPEQMIA